MTDNASATVRCGVTDGSACRGLIIHPALIPSAGYYGHVGRGSRLWHNHWGSWPPPDLINDLPSLYETPFLGSTRDLVQISPSDPPISYDICLSGLSSRHFLDESDILYPCTGSSRAILGWGGLQSVHADAFICHWHRRSAQSKRNTASHHLFIDDTTEFILIASLIYISSPLPAPRDAINAQNHGNLEMSLVRLGFQWWTPWIFGHFLRAVTGTGSCQ